MRTSWYETLESRRLFAANIINGGDLDVTFGEAGSVVIEDASAGAGIVDITVLSDGKVLMLGQVIGESGPLAVVSRLNADGSLDATFGSGGVSQLDGSPASLLVTASGQIVVAGAAAGVGTATFEGVFDLCLQRLNADGTKDTTFGTNGRVTTDTAQREDISVEVLQQPDGKLVVIGYEQRAFLARVHQTPHVVIARYETDGRLDTTFGTGGIVVTDLPDFGAERAAAAALQPDGKIVVVGTAFLREEGEPSPRQFMALRYNADGALDETFGRGGVVVLRQAGTVCGVSVLDDGRIVIGGARAAGSESRAAVFRLRPNGAIDRKFGRGGFASIDFRQLTRATSDGVLPSDFDIQPDGKILVSGTQNGVVLARFTPNGRPDSTFGWNGRAFHENTLARNAESAVQADGKLLVAVDNGTDASLSRVFGDNVPSFARVSHGTLVVEGTERADDILIADAPAPAFRVLSVTRNGYEQRFAREDVARIVVRAGDGDDSVIMAGQIFPAVFFGGRGNDTLHGAGGSDRLLGEEGNDVLDGGAGGDMLSGGPGNDTIHAHDGEADRVAGGSGSDSAESDDVDRLTGMEAS